MAEKNQTPGPTGPTAAEIKEAEKKATDKKAAGDKAAAAAVSGQYPKVLADTTGQDRDNRPAHNAQEESDARADGFTRVVTAATIPAKTTPLVEYPRHVHSKAHGFKVVKSAAEHKQAISDGWQDKPVAQDQAIAPPTSNDALAARVSILETRVAVLERNQQGPAAEEGPAAAKKG